MRPVCVGALDLRVVRAAAEDPAHSRGVLGRFLERDRHGHRRADPEIAFLKLWHEVAAQQGEERDARKVRNREDWQCQLRPDKCRIEEWVIDLVKEVYDEVFLLLELSGK